MEEPPRKVARTEQRDAEVATMVTHLGPSVDGLEKLIANVPTDSCLVLLLHTNDGNGALSSVIDRDAPSRESLRFSAPIGTFNVEAYLPVAAAPAVETSGQEAEKPQPSVEHRVVVTTRFGDVVLCSDVSDLPRLVLLFKCDDSSVKRILSKQVTSPQLVRVTSLVAPVVSLSHMYRTITRAILLERAKHVREQTAGPTYSLMWMSAAWCPPCLRILDALPAMIPGLPQSIVAFFKADMDLTQPIFDAFHVEIIPTFVILDNAKILPDGILPSAVSDEEAAKILLGARVDSLQNSQQATVMTFIEKHCARLSFGLDGDEDF